MEKYWAIFIEIDQVKWTYGIPPGDEEFLTTTVRFIESLQAIGRELYEQGVASIRLEAPDGSAFATKEIFIINLSDQFFFIISDLIITSRLISETIKIPYEIEQIIRAVLVGQAAMLYSHLKETEQKLDYSIDNFFREILLGMKLNYELDGLVADGRFSLSPLNFQELLSFHYLLRNRFESMVTAIRTPRKDSWAIMVDTSGIDIPMAYLSPKDPLLLGNFLGAIYSYIYALFGVKPSALIFGGHELIYLRFFGGKKYFLAASNPQTLFQDQIFFNMLQAIPKLKRQDIEAPITEFLLQCTTELFEENLRKQLGQQESTVVWSIYRQLADKAKRSLFSQTTIQNIAGIGKKAIKALNSVNITSISELANFSLGNPPKLPKELVNAGITLAKFQKWQKQAKKILITSDNWILNI